MFRLFRIGFVVKYRVMATVATKITKTDEEWKKELSAEEYNVLRKKGMYSFPRSPML
jgi:hypothetical protein